MNERIWLVAKREFFATLVTRAFIMLMLTPVIVAISVPLIVAPLVMVAETLAQAPPADAGDAPAAVVVELVDPEASFEARLSDRLGKRYKVERVSGDTPLLDSEAELRVVLEPSGLAEGRYRLEAEEAHQARLAGHIRTVSRATSGAVTRARLEHAGLDATTVDAAFTVDRDLTWVAHEDANLTTGILTVLTDMVSEMADFLAPLGALFIMFSALSMSGQGLLTSTLEEKTTRVSELLLGAVSPVELLTGKALGQLAVGLVISAVWGGPGLVVLWWFAVYSIGPVGMLYLLILIGFASLSWAAVMGGIGSAMNDLTEAQNILAPLFMVMMLLFIPALLAIATPDSGAVLLCSLLPPTAAPVMAARVTSATPPPHWQVWVGILSSGGFAVALLWAAGRLYRIGLLVRGAPPDLRTLLRWIRTG